MDTFSDYGPALVSVILYAVVAQVLNAATGIRKGGEDIAPGASQEPDYQNASYRLDRTYMNTIEMMVFFIALVFAAILAGANPLWVNMLASAGVSLRIAANIFYIKGIGKAYGGLRTKISILASIVNLALATLAFLAIF